MKKTLSSLVFAVTLSAPLPAPLHAQTYAKLTPYSDYSCITISSGHTYVGKVTPSGYDNEPFSDVRKTFKSRISANERKISRYQELLADLADDESVAAKRFLEAINDLKSFYKNEKDTPAPPKTRKEKIDILKRAITADKTVLKGYKAQLGALSDCQQHKTKHKIGFFTAEFILYGGFAGYYLVSNSSEFDSSGYFCVKGDKGFQVIASQILPCVGILPNCSERDGTPKYGIPLCTASADHPLTDEEKINFTQYLDETCGGSYEAKPDTFKNGAFTPCKDVFGLK